MKAHKLPSGSYRVRVCIGKDADGKYRYKSFTAKTKRAAEFAAADYLENHTDDEEKSTATIAEAIETYLADRSSVLSPSTMRGHRQIQGRYFDEIGDRIAVDFDTQAAQAFINDLASKVSPKTTRNVYGLLLSAIRYQNPNAVLNPHLPQKKRPHLHTPTDEEVKRLIDGAGPELRLAILLASVGTLRRGEICGLDYSDIKDNFVHVQRVVVLDENKNWVTKEVPKTSESERWVEYPRKVIQMIGKGEGRIISATPDQISGRFRRLKNKLGISCRFHDLRHYAASIMHAIGVPDQYIMERGGWKTDTVLKSVYRDILEDKRNEFTEQTNDYFSENFLSDM